MSKKFNWCGVDWVCEMEGGRIIHPDNPWYYYDQSCIDFISNNIVELTMKHAPRDVKYWDGTIYHPTTGCGLIRSVDEFGYGTFTAEIKMPSGALLWPSFWLSGVGKWPDNGEIDIVEAWSNSNSSYYQPLLYWKTTHNIHWKSPTTDLHKQLGPKSTCILKQPKVPSSKFIKYECEWRPNKITFKQNNKITKEYGWDVAQYLVGKKMKVIFDIWPSSQEYKLDTNMVISNFNYKPL